MKSASFYAAYIVKKLWTLAALLLVVFALLISILRFSLPYMEGQKSRLEGWLSNQYGVELSIGSLSASWTKSGPALVLNELQLKQDAQSPIGLKIDRTEVELDFWASLLAWQIQSKRFELDGLDFQVDLAQIQMSETQFPIVEALESLFLEQLQAFSVTNSLVSVNTRFDEQLIEIQQLRWMNRDERHQGVGKLRVVELANNLATFTLDLYGTKNNLHGNFYATGEEIDLSPWLNQLVKTQNQLTQSRGNFVFWAGIENGLVDSVQVQLNRSEFEWTTPEAQVEAAILGGKVRGIPDAQGWKLNIEDLTLESQGQTLVTSWAGHLGRDGLSRFNSTSAINVEALLPVLPLLFDAKTMDFIEQLSPQARVDQLALLVGDQFALRAEFSQLGWNQVDAVPGLANLTGSFEFADQLGRLKVNGVAGQLVVDNTLADNLTYQNLQIDTQLRWHDRGVLVYVPQFRFASDSISFEQSLKYDSADGVLSLAAELGSDSVAQVKTLFSDAYMGKQTVAYLNRALEAGNIEQARIVWQGPVEQFPFAQNQGVFQASVDMTDVTLRFDPEWPALTELDLNLRFENTGMEIFSEQGQLANVSMQQLHARIPEFAEDATLLIEATAQASSEQVTALLADTFLAESLGDVLSNQVKVDGVFDTDLTLSIPFSDQDVVASGAVNLAGNQVYIDAVDMTLRDARGPVRFENDKVTIESLQANLFEQPVEVSFSGADDPKLGYVADINLQGDWKITPLLAEYHPAMQTYLSGSAKWSNHTQLILDAEGYRYTSRLESGLEGVSTSLPAPFFKESNQALSLVVTSQGDNQASTVNLTLGKDVRFDGVLPHDTLAFSRAHLAVGDNETLSMGLGFSIFADVAYADFDAWFEVINLLVDDLPESDNPVLGAPQRIHVNADRMLVAGQNIENLELVAKHSTQDWLLDFNAEQIRAEVIFYHDWLDRGIDIKADFIELAEWQGEQSMGVEQSTLKNLPPVRFECKSCRILDKDLGRVDFSLSRASTGMTIDQLRINNRNGILYANGDWFMSGQGASTRLKGELSSSDFGAFLKGLGLDSGIKDSKAKFDFDLSWQDAPHKFSLATLNGGVDWRLTDGYLSDVSDKGARLFSILSLQSLVRKLSLDFRDVFAKGFFYDKMKGSFQLSDGRASTDDTVIDGAAGEMTIAGYTDLNSQQLNYQIEFTPNVTSSLPLLVYWMVNPATAVAALALDKVLTEAKVISNVRYSITGTLDEPVMTELDRKSKDVTLPARNDSQSEGSNIDIPPDVLNDERVSLELSDG